FFQAEDGIRDFHVTGVRRVLFRSSELKKSLEDLNNFYSQIAKNRIKRLSGQKQEIIREVEQKKELLKKSHKQFDEKLQYLNVHRSEERRVGKECRYRWWMYH